MVGGAVAAAVYLSRVCHRNFRDEFVLCCRRRRNAARGGGAGRHCFAQLVPQWHLSYLHVHPGQWAHRLPYRMARLVGGRKTRWDYPAVRGVPPVRSDTDRAGSYPGCVCKITVAHMNFAGCARSVVKSPCAPVAHECLPAGNIRLV
jgi:hypothetical protein